MRTDFTLAQLADPEIDAANTILRTCVHCGFCTATCPTYVLLGDELDSPRGRIYMIKNLLESGQPATAKVVKDNLASPVMATLTMALTASTAMTASVKAMLPRRKLRRSALRKPSRRPQKRLSRPVTGALSHRACVKIFWTASRPVLTGARFCATSSRLRSAQTAVPRLVA